MPRQVVIKGTKQFGAWLSTIGICALGGVGAGLAQKGDIELSSSFTFRRQLPTCSQQRLPALQHLLCLLQHVLYGCNLRNSPWTESPQNMCIRCCLLGDSNLQV